VLTMMTAAKTRSVGQMPWIERVLQGQSHDLIESIRTTATVTVSDGLAYQAHSFYIDPQRAIFRVDYPDRSITRGLEGKYAWQHRGDKEEELPIEMETFILGHQLHAQLLFFDRLHPIMGQEGPDSFNGQKCTSITASDDRTEWKIYLEKEVPLAFELLRPDAASILFTLNNWEQVAGLLIPTQITIDDGQRIFEYVYSNFEINEGDMRDYYLIDTLLTDEQRLLRLHRAGMDDHLLESIDGLRAGRADTLTIVSRGEISTIDGMSFDSFMERIMTSRDHVVYDDLVRPMVKVSDDGSLGWVIVQVAAQGNYKDEHGMTTEPLDFVSAWIELYEKKDGVWKMTGNVSNFKI